MKTPQREVTLILGQTGCGKTHLAREIIAQHPRVLIVDCGFQEFGVPPFREFGALLDYLDEREAFGTHRPFHASIDPAPADFGRVFDTAIALGDCLLVLEEADRFSEAVGDYEGVNDDGYREVVYRGRHYGVSLLLISLSPRAIPTEVRRQTTRLVSFRQIFPEDIKWLRDVVGPDAEHLPSLPGPPQSPPHPRLEWTQHTGSKIIVPPGHKPLDSPAPIK